MALTVPERIAQCAEQICADDTMGYSQTNREGSGSKLICFSDGSSYTIRGGDLDCSEMVRRCVNAALGGEVIPYLWTGNEDAVLKSVGFERVAYSPANATRGTVLWRPGHTGVALGGGMQAEAYIDERGGITGPTKGDQTGWEVRRAMLADDWTAAYRWPQGRRDPSGDTTQEGDEMVCIIQPNGEGYLEYFDGTKVHPLAHPDEVTAIDMVYQATHGGAHIPCLALGTKDAPWATRLHDAVGR